MCLKLPSGHVFFSISRFQLLQKGFRIRTTCGLRTESIQTAYGCMSEYIPINLLLCLSNPHLFGVAMNAVVGLVTKATAVVVAMSIAVVCVVTARCS